MFCNLEGFDVDKSFIVDTANQPEKDSIKTADAAMLLAQKPPATPRCTRDRISKTKSEQHIEGDEISREVSIRTFASKGVGGKYVLKVEDDFQSVHPKVL